MKRWAKAIFVWISISLFPGLSGVQADELSDRRTARATIIGPVIATGANYTVHSPQADKSGGDYRCTQPAHARMSDAEYTNRMNAIQKAARDEKAAIMKAKTDLMNKRRVQPPMPHEAYLAELKLLQDRESAAALKAVEDQKVLDREWSGPSSASNDYLALTVQHVPRDANTSIIPFEGQFPSASFIADLNRTLKPFLASCGNRSWVTVAHVYRDLFPYGMPDIERRYEGTITAYNYTLTGGALALDAKRNTASWLATHGPSDDPRFTLASIQGRIAADVREAARAHAEYRQDFADASRRKPGIVYKLDPYWAQYRSHQDFEVDALRRVFDGDFAGQKGRAAFKSLFRSFAGLYSSACTAQVTTFVRYKVRFPEVAATRTYLDGHVEHDYTTSDDLYDIDERFAPQWADYWPAAKIYPFVAVGKVQRNGRTRGADDRVVSEAIRNASSAARMPLFFSNHSCTSAAMTQMRENLVRAANGRNSIQADGVVLPNAERDSDPPNAGQTPVRQAERSTPRTQ